MNENFKLSERLKLFLSIGSRYSAHTLGNKFAVSIRKRYGISQRIVIYPEADYNFFTSREVMCFISLANGLGLDSFVEIENGVPVIKITDYKFEEI